MRTLTFPSTVLLVVLQGHAVAQNNSAPETRTPQPLYQVTIVSRTTKAINYGYLTAPTRIDFQGTPVLADARGEATVEPKRGATLVKMRVDHVPPPRRFGPQYLTYVVWAISPEGRAQNIGELIFDGSEKARLSTSTPMQTFAMIVTAEPYYSVTQPSEVVVMENVVGRNTIGKVQEVNATYELLPRKPFTYDVGSEPKAPTREVSKEQYESITALYQALNAIQIAQSQGADRYAPEQMARAREVYNTARAFPVSLSKEIVSMAREATQIAEDGRAIAVKRAEADKAADEQRRSSVEQQATQSPAEPPRTRVTAPQPSSPPPAAPRAPRAAAPVPAAAAEKAPIEVEHSQFLRDNPRASDNRRHLLAALPSTWDVVDSGRGIVITIPEQLTRAASLQSYLAPVAAAIRPYTDLHLEVGGHTDNAIAAGENQRDAERVRTALIGAGIAPDIIAARAYGNTRPRTSNANAAGRAENRRVEIVIAGDAIGILPTWDRTYTLRPSRVGR